MRRGCADLSLGCFRGCLSSALPVHDTHSAYYLCARTDGKYVDHDFCIFYDLIMQIAPQIDATTAAQRKYPDICDSALHLFAAPTQQDNFSPIGSAADASEDKA